MESAAEDELRLHVPAASDLVGGGLAPARCRACHKALVTGTERVLGRCQRCPDTADEHLLAELMAWRDGIATSTNVPGHVVLTDVTLHAIAEALPETASDLALIPGMRPDRVQQYGGTLVSMAARYAVRADPRR